MLGDGFNHYSVNVNQKENGAAVFIPAKDKADLYGKNHIFRTCAYCRGSTDNDAQLSSFELQQEHYQNLADAHPNWELKHIFADEGISCTSQNNRVEFRDMIDRCFKGEFNLIVTKSVSRFGRDTVEGLQMIQSLRANNVEVIFDNEELHSFSPDFDLLYTVAVAQAQFENEDRSDNIRKGIMMQSDNPESKLYNRKCYGYEHDANGELVIVESEAEVIRMIFTMYIEGASVITISNKLSELGISSPTGKEKWSNRTIDTILQNEKYTGEVLLFKTVTGDYPNTKASRLTANMKLCTDHHAPIISKEVFNEAQLRRHKKVLKRINSKRDRSLEQLR